MAVLVLFEQFSGKFCLHVLFLTLSASPKCTLFSHFLLYVLRSSDGHDKPFCSKAITIIDNFKNALGDTDNR